MDYLQLPNSSTSSGPTLASAPQPLRYAHVSPSLTGVSTESIVIAPFQTPQSINPTYIPATPSSHDSHDVTFPNGMPTSQEHSSSNGTLPQLSEDAVIKMRNRRSAESESTSNESLSDEEPSSDGEDHEVLGVTRATHRKIQFWTTAVTLALSVLIAYYYHAIIARYESHGWGVSSFLEITSNINYLALATLCPQVWYIAAKWKNGRNVVRVMPIVFICITLINVIFLMLSRMDPHMLALMVSQIFVEAAFLISVRTAASRRVRGSLASQILSL